MPASLLDSQLATLERPGDDERVLTLISTSQWACWLAGKRLASIDRR